VAVSLFKSCLLAARFKTLPAAIVPVWVACVLAWKIRRVFDPSLALCTLCAALAIQLATNFFNDAIDARKGADTPRRVGPVRVTASGLMRPRAVMAIASGFWGVAMACGMLLYQVRGWSVLAIGVPSLLLTYGYTGGPFPLAYRGMGEAFVIIFFGVVAVAGSVFIQTGEWLPAGFLLGLQIGLLSAVLISINNFRDRDEDATTGKRTLAVRFGPRVAQWLIRLEIGLAAIGGWVWVAMDAPSFAWASVPVLGIGWHIIRGLRVAPSGPDCNRLLALGGIQLLCFAVLFHLAALIL
jgi:1,4-dihydroxy-2-naphthoate octaprenyltransferase